MEMGDYPPDGKHCQHCGRLMAERGRWLCRPCRAAALREVKVRRRGGVGGEISCLNFTI